MVFGKHLIIDANECDEEAIKNIDIINIFIEKLCDIGKMTRKGDLIVETFPYTDFNIENDLVGYSIVQIISLSNITFHINFISKTIYFDFFTCGELNTDKIISYFNYFFKPKIIKKIILNRDAIDNNLSFLL